MGLDFHINLIAQNKETNVIEEIEVCYWRKHWTLANTILRVIKPYIINSDENFEFNCSLDVIQPLINTLCDCIKDYNSEELQDTIWDVAVARSQTIYNLNLLTNLDCLLKFCQPLNLEEIKEYCDEEEFKIIKETNLLDILTHKEKYNLTIQVINSF